MLAILLLSFKTVKDSLKEVYNFALDIFAPDLGPMSRKLVKIFNNSEDREIYLNATKEMREKGLSSKPITLSDGNKMTICL